jgi:hypothetical protein
MPSALFSMPACNRLLLLLLRAAFGLLMSLWENPRAYLLRNSLSRCLTYGGNPYPAATGWHSAAHTYAVTMFIAVTPAAWP